MSPESLTLRVGETGTVSVRILPDEADQSFTVTVRDPAIVEVTS